MKKIIVGICIVISLSTAAMAQTRSRQTTKRPATPKTNTATTDATAAVRTEGATKVATQIKNLSTFLYLLGGVVRGIEAIDASAKDGQTSPTNEKNKVQLRSTF